MTLRQLRYIIALDTHRHFVRAAESCFVSQPTLTIQVQKLEEELGVSLFDRAAQPLVPTELGKAFVQKARQILRDIDDLKSIVTDEQEVLEGTYSLGVIPTLAPYLLPLFLQEFASNFPKINLQILELQTQDMIQGLQAGTVDMGIAVTPLGESNIREISLFQEPFLVFAGAKHPLLQKEAILPSDIQPEGLWLLNQGHCFRDQVLNICHKDHPQTPYNGVSFESGSIETLKNMVRQNMGYTLIPELSCYPVLDEPFVRRFAEPQPVRQVSMLVHTHFSRNLLMEGLRKAIVHNLPSHFVSNAYFRTVAVR